MSPKIGIVVLSGLPAVGKTTLVRRLFSYCKSESIISTLETCKQKRAHASNSTSTPINSISEMHCIHVCFDDIVIGHFYESDSDVEENTWKTCRKCVRLCLEQEIKGLLKEELQRNELREVDLTEMGHPERGEPKTRASKGDLYRMELQDRWIPEDLLTRYKKSWRITRTFSKDGDPLCVFIIDDNMFLRSMRYEYYQVARKYGIGFCQVYIRCSVDEAQKENSMRTATEGMTVSQSTISTMATKFEAPNLENHWEASSFILDQVNCHAINSISEVWQLIVQCIYQPVDSPLEVDDGSRTSDRLICSQSVLHQVDQILRREISKLLKSLQCEKATRKEDLKKTAALLSQKKSSLLEELRSGKIGLPKVLENHVTDACRDEKNPFYAFVKEIFHESTH